MPLPKIEAPRHHITLPISGLDIEYRPYLVKEQKTLLQAMEMGNEDQKNNALVDIATACTFEQLDITDLPVADVEYLILHIRGKSVGETTEVLYTCPHCGEKTPQVMSIADVGVTETTDDHRIMLHDDVGLQMRKASFGDVQRASKMSSDVDKGYALIIACIESVFDTEQVYTRSDFSNLELVEFLESLETKDFRKVEEYVADQPTVTKTFTFKCLSCEKESEYVAEGLANFFR